MNIRWMNRKQRNPRWKRLTCKLNIMSTVLNKYNFNIYLIPYRLFGTEDVDLRTMQPGMPSMSNLNPPPPPMISVNQSAANDIGDWSKMKTDIPTKPSGPSKNSLEAVRARLAAATKRSASSNLNKPTNKGDVDLRQRIDLLNDDSQDGEAKLKMIMMQAHEQVENENLNKEQIQSLVQQMIQITNENNVRENFKRNSFIPPGRISDDEVFSSNSENEELKQSHRIESRKRRRLSISKSSSDSVNKNDSSAKASDSKPNKERRPRKSKWSAAPTTHPSMIPSLMSANPPFPIQLPAMPLNPNVWQQNQLPFVPAAPMHPIGIVTPQINHSNGPTTAIPFIMPQNQIIPSPQIVMAQHGHCKSAIGTKERTINIDNVPREIRFYDEIAIAFMDEHGREPKEIGFQAGERRICVDNIDSITLAFNDDYKTFIIDGKTYRIRFGSPTRELYIDNEWFECYFGEPPVGIYLNNKLRVFKIDGPAPQVRIGTLRTDLVVGRVDMYIDSVTKVSLFLDAQLQTFTIKGQIHTIQFADYFLTAIIDTIPFAVKYGEMPTKFQLSNSEHYIRFSVLPNNIIPGKVFVRNMIRTNMHPNLEAPPLLSEQIRAHSPTQEYLPAARNLGISESQNSDVLEASTSITTDISTAPANNLANLNINELFQKLLASGIIHKTNETTEVKEKEKATPVLLSNPETLKKRQSAIVHTIYSGMQCSSCGVRFPPEQTMKYSQHLDWHYRQNRRDRDSARSAHSRKWYYDVSDWIQYEEIENLEEREKNWFETQQTEQDSTNEESNQRTNSPLPSCVAGQDGDNKICDMCHDQFETFFHEETEEWHLRNAIRVDGRVYHPICFQDYKVRQAVYGFLFRTYIYV